MLSRFTTIIQQAVEALSPNATTGEDFVHHWKSVTNYFLDHKEKMPIEHTNIESHLDQMLVLLQEEEAQVENGSTGPCMEYLLRHKLLETLYTLARTDFPPGMKQSVLKFFTKLLSRIKHPLLPQINVHRAVHRLIKICGEIKCGPTEVEEIQFLCTVCSKIKTDPYLVNFFIESARSSATPTSNTALQSPSSTLPKLEFGLVEALLALTHSVDSWVAVKSCEGLMLCASLPEESSASCMIHNTVFCQELTNRLCQLYSKLPTSVNPTQLENVQAKWGFDIITDRDDTQSFRGKRNIISFLSWLDFCDQLISAANPVIAAALAKSIRENFLCSVLEPALMQVSEVGAVDATVYLIRCLRTVCSQPLVREFCLFILGDDVDPEKPGLESRRLRQRLIDRCDHLSEELCVITLKLFDMLLLKEDEFVIQNLLLRNLLGRDYCDVPLNTSVLDTNNSQTISKQSFEQNVHILNLNKGNSSSNIHETSSCVSSSTDLVTASNSNRTVDSSVSSSSIMEGLNRTNNNNNTCAMNTDSSVVSHQNTDITSNCDNTAVTCAVKTETGDNSENVGTGTSSNMSDRTSELPASILKNESDNGDGNEVTLETSQKESGLGSSVTGSSASPAHSVSSTTISSTTNSSTPSSPLKSEVHRVINSFLTLLPEVAKSSYQTADTGYDTYLRDANSQFSDMQSMCKPWNWPREPLADERFSSKVQFYEGAFLKMMMDKLSRLLKQSYEINLQVTAVISKLALLPHPNIHEYILDPFLSIKPGVRTPFSILQKVVTEVAHHAKLEPFLNQQLLVIRRQLMGVDSCLPSSLTEDAISLEGIIVVEEFCKELSAIAFVKHHASITQL